MTLALEHTSMHGQRRSLSITRQIHTTQQLLGEHPRGRRLSGVARLLNDYFSRSPTQLRETCEVLRGLNLDYLFCR